MEKTAAVASLGQTRLMLPAWVKAALSANDRQNVVEAAAVIQGDLHVPDLPRLVKCFADDLVTMARPVLESAPTAAEPRQRVQQWLKWLDAVPADRLSGQQIEAFIQGRRQGPDSVHLLVMDLHKEIIRPSAELASEVIDGANVWELLPEDHERVAAFMRGLNRTAGLKFDHPGLDTAAGRYSRA
jgi:hypothetical protein